MEALQKLEKHPQFDGWAGKICAIQAQNRKHPLKNRLNPHNYL